MERQDEFVAVARGCDCPLAVLGIMAAFSFCVRRWLARERVYQRCEKLAIGWQILFIFHHFRRKCRRIFVNLGWCKSEELLRFHSDG